jgi:hypothetical protein
VRPRALEACVRILSILQPLPKSTNKLTLRDYSVCLNDDSTILMESVGYGIVGVKGKLMQVCENSIDTYHTY